MSTIHFSDDPKLRTAQKVVFWVVVGLAGMTVFGVLFGLIIQFLWNATLTPMFGVPEIGFWQAVGVFILAKILFGFGAGSSPGSNKQRQMRRKVKKAKARAAEVKEAASGHPADEPAADEPTVDEEFRQFWQQEGRDAYQAYQSRKSED